MHLAPGDRVDRFLLQERIGQGGQAEVWRAEDSLSPGSPSAIKLLHSTEEIERVRREAFELARLRHPCVVRGQGIFENHQSRVGVVMELVEGRTLLGLIGDPRLDERAKFFLLLHVASALEHVHAHGIVHRDVKLENVIVTDAFFRAPHDPSTVKLIDFGIAVRSRNPHPLTRAGFVMGTTPYLAPEQVDPRYFGARDTAEVDVFAFGILAWRVLAGDAFQHPTGLRNGASLDDFAIAYRRAEHDRWLARAPHHAYRSLLKRALALRSRHRLRNGAELVRELGRVGTLDDDTALSSLTIAEEPPTLVYLREPPTLVQSRPRRRWPFLLAAAALLVATAIGVSVALQPEDDFVPPLPAHVGRGPI